MIRVLLFAVRFHRLARENPTLVDGHAARLGIEAVIAEERHRLGLPAF